ncbi:MAG: response regulator [Candidatus Pacebacteria bacterium]|nr:response regulator [Candidatus Paceibacterota bacterium]
MGIVLIAEDDDRAFEEMFVETLEEMGVTVIRAKTLQEGIEMFDANKEQLSGVVVDGCLNNRHILDGLDLVEHIRRQGWGGIIIPASQSDDNNERMVQLGATRKPYASGFRVEKESAINLLRREMRKAKIFA